MARKRLAKNSPGTATTWAADDWDRINEYLLDFDQSSIDPVSIKTNTSFWDNRLRIWNPAKTKVYRIRGLAILNDYDLTLPLITSNDEVLALLATQTPQNKVININQNTLKHSATNAIGDLLVGNGTKYDRLAMGATGGHVLAIKSDLTGLEWIAAAGGGGSGEVNTGSNVGTAGVGVFKLKSGVTLQFKKINTASSGLITVTDDTANSEIDVGITGGTDGQYLKTVGTTPTWSTLTSLYGIVLPDGTNYSGRKYGTLMGGATYGDGLLSRPIIQGTITGSTSSTMNYTHFTSDATDDAVAGWSSVLSCVRRTFNPHFKVRFGHVQATEKGWTGLLNLANYPGGGSTGANPLVNQHGAMVGYDDSDPNWLIRWNNGGATPQTFNTGIAKDTGMHTVEFWLEDVANSVKVIWDGTQVVNSTIQVPGLGHAHSMHNYVESVGGTATELKLAWAYVIFDTVMS